MAMPLRSGGSERIMEDRETTAGGGNVPASVGGTQEEGWVPGPLAESEARRGAAPPPPVGQPATAPPPFPAAPPAPLPGAGKATAALALGIAAIVLCAAPLLGIALGAAAVLVAGSYRKLLGGDGGGDPRAGRAKAGRVCGFVGIGLGALWTLVWAAAIAMGAWAVSVAGIHEGPDPLAEPPAATQGPSTGGGPEADPSGGSSGGSAADPDDVIIAGGADASSKYVFEVDTAVVGLDEYSEAPVVVLVGDFTNESDETVSFSDALGATASQGGRELSSAYLRGADAFNYESIAPGETVPVFVGWELGDAESDVEIVVYDQYHYAKQAVFEGAYTIDELLANTEALSSELEGIIDEEQELAA